MLRTAAVMALLALAPAVHAAAIDEELSEVVVTAPEPLYVAPTTRDRIGRVWVPVSVDGHGPFRMVLDTGAQRSAITTTTAARLGIPLNRSRPVMLHGATGSAVTPTIPVDFMQVGDLWLKQATVPVVADVFGGADGLLGTDGMQDRRIYIDFRNDLISITRSQNRAAANGFSTVRFLPDAKNLLVVNARVGNLPVRAIFDTGAQASVGNLALQAALRRQLRERVSQDDRIQGATGEWQTGVGNRLAPLTLGNLTVRDAYATFADLRIFESWDMQDEPVLLIGMDLIGLLDQLVIDYRRRELQLKPRTED